MAAENQNAQVIDKAASALLNGIRDSNSIASELLIKKNPIEASLENQKELSDKISDKITMLSDMLQKVTHSYKSFIPDASGYFVAFHVPGTWVNKTENLEWLLSGNKEEVGVVTELVKQFNRSFPTLAIDVNPPSAQINIEQVNSRSTTTPILASLKRGSDFSITYLETRDAIVSRYHQYWIEYMSATRKGIPYNSLGQSYSNIPIPLPQDSAYADNEFYELDYASAFWICKFQPMSMTPIYIAKALGAIPTNIPQKELIGSRGMSELTRVSYQYQIADFYYKYINYNSKDPFGTSVNPFDAAFFSQFVSDYDTYVLRGN